MKILVMPNKLSNIDNFKDSAGFIVGVKDLSWFMPLELTIDDLKELAPKIKALGKQLFISLNKLMYNEDIPLLKEYLLIIEQLDVDGILYDDLAVYNMTKNLGLKTPLGWFGVHSFTNYRTSNFWYQKEIKYGVLSTEIPLDHIKLISENTKLSTMMYGYGYLPMFVSSRPLLNSYFEHIDGKKEPKVYHMYEEARKMSYPTYENENGTVILSAEIINSINELPVLSNMVDYLILSSLNIPDANFYKIYKHYVEAVSYLDNKDMLNNLSQMVSDDSPAKTDKGFMYKETVYRVKE